MKSPIQPSVGRVVLVRLPVGAGMVANPEMPAIVTDATMGSDEINVMVLQDMGTPYPVGSVDYLQDDPTDADATLPTGMVWRWMDYQLRNPDRAQATPLEPAPLQPVEQVITLKLDASSLIDAIPKIMHALALEGVQQTE